MRHQDEAVTDLVAHVPLHAVGDRGGGSHEGLTGADLDHQLTNGQALGSGQFPPLLHGPHGVLVHADRSAARGDGLGPDERLDIGKRSVRVVVGQVAVPHLLHQLDGGCTTHLLLPDVAGLLLRLGIGRPEHEGGRRQDDQLVGAAPVAGQAPLDVGVEGPTALVAAVPGENGVRGLGCELPPLLGISRLQYHRPPLRTPRNVEAARDLEMLVAVVERPCLGIGEKDPGVLVRHDLLTAPGVEQLPRCEHELAGPAVALLLGQEAAAPEVLAGEGVPRRDHVPGTAPAGEVIERGELARHLVGLVERRVDGPGQSQPVRDRGQSGKDGEGVGAADDVEVVDLASLLPKAQSLGQKEKVELGPLRGLGEVDEGGELDVAARAGIAPNRRVVHAREMGRQMDLPMRRHLDTSARV